MFGLMTTTRSVVTPEDSRLSGESGWLDAHGGPLYTVLHRPAINRARATGVLIVPPFGWHEVCSERGRLEWAAALAQAGYPALRFDLPGTAESIGSPRDDGLLGKWLTAIADAADCLRNEAGADHVVALGIGIGGLLALQASAAGAELDGFILWGAAGAGRTHIREMRAHTTMTASRFPEQRVGEVEPGVSELTGYVMSDETSAALSAVTVGELGLDGAGRTVLTLGRGEFGIEDKLVQALIAAEFEVTIRPCGGYAAFLDAHPERNRRPSRAIAESISWLEEKFADAAGTGLGDMVNGHQAGAHDARNSIARFTEPAGSWTEQLVSRKTRSGFGSGVLCEPDSPTSADVCFVFMNSGTRRRCGPNRMWVEASRRWASQGWKTARVDLDGLGDSDGERHSEVTRPAAVESLCEWLDELAARGFASRFVLLGLSSGAINSLAATARDHRVVGVIALNPPDIPASDAYRAELRRRRLMVNIRDAVVTVLHRQTPPHIEVSAVLGLVGDLLRGKGFTREGRRHRRDLLAQFTQWRDLGVTVGLYLSVKERIRGWMEEDGLIPRLREWPNLRLECPTDVWDHDLRALWVQRAVHAWIDEVAIWILVEADAAPPLGLDAQPSPPGHVARQP
jgi:pimeloyl-ACP methyl ester carboxylesterase